MAPLILRQFIGNNNNNDDCDFNDDNCGGAWNNWARWVFLGLVIVFFVLAALTFSCINARRRRRYGMTPRYGTGWAAGKTPIGHAAPQYNPNAAAPPYSGPGQAPPVYGQNTGTTFNSNDGYYGQQSGIELQQPQHVYQQPPYNEEGLEQGYAPPPGRPVKN